MLIVIHIKVCNFPIGNWKIAKVDYALNGEVPPQFLEKKNLVGQLKSPDEYEPNDTTHWSIRYFHVK